MVQHQTTATFNDLRVSVAFEMDDDEVVIDAITLMGDDEDQNLIEFLSDTVIKGLEAAVLDAAYGMGLVGGDEVDESEKRLDDRARAADLNLCRVGL